MEFSYLVGAKNQDGVASMTLGQVVAGKPSPANRELAKRRARLRWYRLGYTVRKEDIVILRIRRVS